MSKRPDPRVPRALPELPLILPADAGPPPCSALPDLWFPERGNTDEQRRYADRVCSMCEHQKTCRDAARDNDEPHGIWGGESTRQRQHAKRART
ncbi:WhiB family transcriptional regulator [Streptomyces sp. NPDC102364]|uniref:WhiB family transcriptional regulator n=1 Tax=Streptomyces sp. NPDC102364 TaxID=3366161 RepID=UPI0038286799